MSKPFPWIERKFRFDFPTQLYPAIIERLRAADMSNRATEDADHNSEDIEGLLRRFREGREALVRRLEALEPDDFARTAFHRRLGVQMRIVDMAYFHSEHDDHHLAQIRWLSRQL